MKQHDDAFDLEAAFGAARDTPPQMPVGLGARILTDAEAYLPRAPLMQRLMTAIGGAVGLGGLVTATVVGFWIGVAPPDGIGDPLGLVGVDMLTEDVNLDADVDEAFMGLGGVGWDSEEG